jgi:MFS family permease
MTHRPPDDGPTEAEVDRDSRFAALTMALALPGDVLLYLLLPLHAAEFGVTLPEVGLLLAANRLVRIFGYGQVASLYAHRGPRVACMAAALAAIAATSIYVAASGLWALLVARILWGLAFGALNISNQALPTTIITGAARRSARVRAIVSTGSVSALVAGSLMAEFMGPRPVFLLLAVAAVPSLYFASRLPDHAEGRVLSGPRFAVPAPMDVWSFFSGLTLDGLFVVGLSVLAAGTMEEGAGLAVGLAMSTRYLAEIIFAAPGGALAHRVGARRMLIIFSLCAAVGMLLVGVGGMFLWIGAVGTTVLRALIQPLPAPVVAEENPGRDRIPALARQASWRDIGAGAGPLLAGFLLPVLPALAIYGVASLLLAGASLALTRRQPPKG